MLRARAAALTRAASAGARSELRTWRGLHATAASRAGAAAAALPDPLACFRAVCPEERASQPDATVVARDVIQSEEHPGKFLVVRTRRKKRGGRGVRLTPRPVPAGVSKESEAAAAGWAAALAQNGHLSQAEKDAFYDRLTSTLTRFEDQEYMDYEDFFELPEVGQFERPTEEEQHTRTLFLQYAGTYPGPRKKAVVQDHLSEYYDAVSEEDDAWEEGK